ncbi:MAG: ABC transporter permease, partial [Bacteroidetes bacterium]|nr:ABC transporter permease [Bacteroidota bacterium]
KSAAVCYSVFQSRQIKYKGNVANDALIWAASHEFENVRSFEIEKGRYFSPEESASGKNVAIVGSVLAEKLFEKTNPVGKEISIGGNKSMVIGVFRKEGKGGLSDDGMDKTNSSTNQLCKELC